MHYNLKLQILDYEGEDQLTLRKIAPNFMLLSWMFVAGVLRKRLKRNGLGKVRESPPMYISTLADSTAE